MDYLELIVTLQPVQPFGEILVAQLAECGFESFVDFENGIKAYGQTTLVTKELAFENTFLSEKRDDVKFQVEVNLIKHQNWNAQWESDFEPVFVEDKVSILAPFHDKSLAKGIIVEIQPQMSFGTGHHETTWMMSKALVETPDFPSTILDMGTGTGVLAILSEKLGAKSILAIDIEDWSVENTIENAQRNDCSKIEAKCGDVDLIRGQRFDLIVANINKNVLKAHMEHYSNALKESGKLLLSGFFDSDVDELKLIASQYNLKFDKLFTKNNWAGIQLIKAK